MASYQRDQIKTTMRYHTGQNGHHNNQSNKQVWERLWRKGYPSALLVGMQTGATTMEKSLESPQKIKMDLPFDPAIPLLRLYPKSPETPIQKNMHFSVHSSTMYNSRVLEAT